MNEKQKVVDKLEGKQAEGMFSVTSVCKDDLRDSFSGNKKVLKKIDELDETDMEYLASKLADDYCNQLYWQSLKIIFEDRFL